IWEYANKSVKGQPAPFPEKLAEDHIISWRNPCDIILDPFVGSGTTAKTSVINDRRYQETDIREEYVEITMQRVDKKLTNIKDKRYNLLIRLTKPTQQRLSKRRIPNGSLIAIKPMSLANLKDGDIVVFSDEYEYSVKRMYQQDEHIVFRPHSTDIRFYEN